MEERDRRHSKVRAMELLARSSPEAAHALRHILALLPRYWKLYLELSAARDGVDSVHMRYAEPTTPAMRAILARAVASDDRNLERLNEDAASFYAYLRRVDENVRQHHARAVDGNNPSAAEYATVAHRALHEMIYKLHDTGPGAVRRGRLEQPHRSFVEAPAPEIFSSGLQALAMRRRGLAIPHRPHVPVPLPARPLEEPAPAPKRRRDSSDEKDPDEEPPAQRHRAEGRGRGRARRGRGALPRFYIA